MWFISGRLAYRRRRWVNIFRRPQRSTEEVGVLPTLQLDGYPEVFVIGDMACVDQSGRRLPMLATVAIQEGEYVAKSLQPVLQRRTPAPFHYRDPGIMTTIGRRAAVVQSGRLRLAGFLGWLAWLAVHLVRIVSLRSRLAVLLNWAWNDLFYDRPIRLILSASATPEGAVDASSQTGTHSVQQGLSNLGGAARGPVERELLTPEHDRD